VLAASTVVLIALALIFNAGGSAPELFGKNVYIVKTDAFGEIKNGSAVFTSRTNPAELVEGNLVVFENSERVAGLAEITASELRDGVYSFTAVSERGMEILLTGSQIIGRAVQYSEFMGALVTFAKSSVGVLCIAILPCSAILVGEVGAALRRVGKKGNVNPIKKQEETPTFIPRPQQTTSVAQAVKSYGSTNDGMTAADVLFTSPRTAVPALTERERKALEAAQRLKQRPVSQARLNEVIDSMKNKGAPPKPASQSVKSTVPDKTGVPDLSALKDEGDKPIPVTGRDPRDEAAQPKPIQPAAPAARRRPANRSAEPVRPVIDRESLAAQILEQASEVDDGFLSGMSADEDGIGMGSTSIPPNRAERIENRMPIPNNPDSYAENSVRTTPNINRPTPPAYGNRSNIGGYGNVARPAINQANLPNQGNQPQNIRSQAPQNMNNTQNIRSQGVQPLNVVPNPRTPGAPRISPLPAEPRPVVNRPQVPGNVVNRAARQRPAPSVRRPVGEGTASLNLLRDEEDPGYNLGNILNGIEDERQ
jgi:hypothetical protein